jgi:hypothetical protein
VSARIRVQSCKASSEPRQENTAWELPAEWEGPASSPRCSECAAGGIDRVDESQPCDSPWPGSPHIERDCGAGTVPDHARAFDTEHVQESNHAQRMARYADIAGRPVCRRRVASPVSQEIRNDDAVADRQQRDNAGPKVGRGREAMHQQQRLAGAATAARVVVQSRPADIDELTPHREPVGIAKLFRGCRPDVRGVRL